jgi:hypothetical protein
MLGEVDRLWVIGQGGTKRRPIIPYPDNTYTQYMFGFGRYVERRLERLVKDGSLPEVEALQVRRIMARQRMLAKRKSASR